MSNWYDATGQRRIQQKKIPSDGCPSEGIIVEVWVGMMGKASSNEASPKALLGQVLLLNFNIIAQLMESQGALVVIKERREFVTPPLTGHSS